MDLSMQMDNPIFFVFWICIFLLFVAFILLLCFCDFADLLFCFSFFFFLARFSFIFKFVDS